MTHTDDTGLPDYDEMWDSICRALQDTAQYDSFFEQLCEPFMALFSVGDKVTVNGKEGLIVRILPSDFYIGSPTETEYVVEFYDSSLIPPRMTVSESFLQLQGNKVQTKAYKAETSLTSAIGCTCGAASIGYKEPEFHSPRCPVAKRSQK